MLGLPKSTETSLQLFKKDILENFTGSAKQKDLFNREIQAVKIVNELSTRSLPIEPSETINGIFFIEVTIKQKNISESTIKMLFRLIPQNIVLILEAEGEIRLVVRNINIFSTEWLDLGYNIHIDGLSVDAIWKSLVEQIGGFRVQPNRSLKEQIEIDTKIQTLKAQIEKLEKQKNNTKTPRMKFELHEKIQTLAEKVEKLERV